MRRPSLNRRGSMLPLEQHGSKSDNFKLSAMYNIGLILNLMLPALEIIELNVPWFRLRFLSVPGRLCSVLL